MKEEDDQDSKSLHFGQNQQKFISARTRHKGAKISGVRQKVNFLGCL